MKKTGIYDDENQSTEIDFARKETEAGWIRILDNLGKRATPAWFNLLGWILIMAGFQYLFYKSHSIIVGVIITISVGLLWLHFQAFFYRLRFKNFPILRWWDHSLVPSMVVSGIMALGSWYLALWIIQLIARSQ